MRARPTRRATATVTWWWLCLLRLWAPRRVPRLVEGDAVAVRSVFERFALERPPRGL